MPTPRRVLTFIGFTTAIYLLACALFGPVTLAHWFVTVTAIDQWHPNWPDPTTVDTVAGNLQVVVTALALIFAAAVGIVYVLRRWLFPVSRSSAGVALPSTAMGAATVLARKRALYRPGREEFATDLTAMLVEAGAPVEQAELAVETAMASTTSKDPADWAGQVRDEALGRVGFAGQAQRVISDEPHLEQTAEFLRAYGFRAVRIKHVEGSDRGEVLNFGGILVWYRSEATDAENALIELLIYAHQAHLASMEDTGERAQRERVERYTESLGYACQKLALRGFVPPELDAEIGRDGTATAEELHRWAVAQVVGTCSPMAQTPLPTVERTIVGQSVGDQS